MDRSTVDKLLDAQERFFSTEEYRALWEELQMRNREFLAARESMSQVQRDAVDDYMGLIHEIHRKLLCFTVERSEL